MHMLLYRDGQRNQPQFPGFVMDCIFILKYLKLYPFVIFCLSFIFAFLFLRVAFLYYGAVLTTGFFVYSRECSRT